MKDIGKLGFGMMRLPRIPGTNEYDMEQLKAMVDHYMASGFGYFDTAFTYDGGGSERAVKEALADRYPRASYLLTTKMNTWLNCDSAEAAQAQLFTSLERTGAGYFDYYLLHGLQPGNYKRYEAFGAWNFVKEQKEAGRIRHYGFSFHGSPELLEELLTEHPDVDVVQLQINYADWEDQAVCARKNYEIARAHGKQILVMEPVKGGLLANPPADVAEILHAADPKASPASWAIRFVASLDGILMVLSGMSTLEQVQDNTAFMKDFQPLTEEECSVLKQAAAVLKQHTMVPCTSCCYCVFGCPQHIMIPELFDILNLYSTYQDLHTACHHYEMHTMTTGKAGDCIRCGKCAAACPQHLPIPDLLEQCKELFE